MPKDSTNTDKDLSPSAQNPNVATNFAKEKKPKNLWPYGILLVILLGVVLISVSIRISVQNPVVDDVPFFIKHDDMDSRINDLLESTQALQSDFDFFIDANAMPASDEALRLYSPYMRPPHRDKPTQNTQTTLYTKTLNTLFLRVASKKKSPQNLRIQAFIQKIGKLDEQEIFIYNPQDSSYTSLKPSKKGAQIPIGMLVKQNPQNPQASQSKEAQDIIYASPFFMLELEGRWIVSLQIDYDDNAENADKQGDKEGKENRSIVVLEKEFFALPNHSADSNNAKK